MDEAQRFATWGCSLVNLAPAKISFGFVFANKVHALKAISPRGGHLTHTHDLLPPATSLGWLFARALLVPR